MTAADFRRRHRAYGLAVPLAEVSPLLACGWRLADPDEAYHAYPFVVLTPPADARSLIPGT